LLFHLLNFFFSILPKSKKNKWVFALFPILLIFSSRCQNISTLKPELPTDTSFPALTHTSTTTQTKTRTPIVSPSTTSTTTPQPTSTFIQSVGCLEPKDDYALIQINGMIINQRTLEMLNHAQLLYGGELELTGYHLTQGSYTNEVSASFGTHSGGGAVDISVIRYGVYEVLYQDIEPLILALRTAGFAAWLRDYNQLYSGSPIHIHAIAIGDRDLSTAAKDQLTGDFGYFRGFNGLPQPEGYSPIQDEYGGPILCQWMIAQGYKDLRTSTP